MPTQQATNAEYMRAAELEGKFAEYGGYNAEARAAGILMEAGIPASFHDGPMRAVAPGLKLRVLLAQALFSKPDVLLLDEPTNNLDIHSIGWLEGVINAYDATMVIISHDRHFLNQVCTHIADLDFQQLRVYPGNYDDFMLASTQARQRVEASNAKAKDRISDLQEFIRRFSANASKSRQATSRRRQLEKIKLEEIKPSSRQNPYIRFEQAKKLYRSAVSVEKLCFSYPGAGTEVLRDVSFTIEGGERIAIIGPHGVGKTTLMRCLAGELSPSAGSVSWTDSAQLGYMPQDPQAEFVTKMDLFEWMSQFTGRADDDQIVRATLGRLLFSGEETKKSVQVLSGGERGRMIYGKLMLAKPNVLLLDEPTNHMDMETIESLQIGLEKYPGTLIFVSHDREFVGGLATRIIELRAGGASQISRGRYDEYLTSRGSPHRSLAALCKWLIYKERRSSQAARHAPGVTRAAYLLARGETTMIGRRSPRVRTPWKGGLAPHSGRFERRRMTRSSSRSERTLTAIAALYDAALDERLWPDALAKLTQLSASQASSFWVLDNSRRSRLSTFLSINFDARAIADYLGGMAALDPTVRHLLAHPRDSIVHDGMLGPGDDEDTRTYLDWHERNVETRFRLVGQSELGSSLQAGIALHRTRSAGRYDPHDIAQFALVHEHLQRALAVGLRLGSLATTQQITADLLDRNVAAVMLLDDRRRIVFMNRAAEELEAPRRRSCASRPTACTPPPGTKMNIYRPCSRAPSICSEPGIPAVKSSRVSRPSGRQPYGVRITAVARPPVALTAFRPAVCLLIGDPELPAAPSAPRLQVLFNMTRAEARLAARLGAGLSLRTAASRLGITYGTARSRLTQLFRKTNTQSQPQLVRLLLTVLVERDT